jgi:predicted GIY-YIG superfamily endonuclease
MFVCYCIKAQDCTRTYIGATNDFNRRIRQHNREISGGAKSTAGHKWEPIIQVVGFTERKKLLRFEWYWKHVIKTTEKGIYRRINMLESLLEKEEWKSLKILTTIEIAPLILCSQTIDSIDSIDSDSTDNIDN